MSILRHVRQGAVVVTAAALASLALFTVWVVGQSGGTPSLAAQNNEFTMAVPTAGCETGGSSTKCQLDVDEVFDVVINLDKFSLDDNDGDTTAGYNAFQARIDNTEGINVGAHTIDWPDCSFPAGNPGNQQFFGCSLIGAESVYTGALTTVTYTCKASGTLTLVHNAVVGTQITDDFDAPVADDSDGASESLTVNCGAGAAPTDTPVPPTATATTEGPTPTATSTSEPGEPTNTPGPTNTPVPTNTPGPTATPPDVVQGDANGDGLVNSGDALVVLQYEAGIAVNINLEAADQNGDGVVNSIDALFILWKEAGVYP